MLLAGYYLKSLRSQQSTRKDLFCIIGIFSYLATFASMKIKKYIATVLATYMFALMLLPCNDNCDIQHHEMQTIFKSVQDHHEADNDICSPFCFCSCCATAITIHNFPTFGFIPQLSIQNFSILELAFVSNANASIWQPPKIN